MVSLHVAKLRRSVKTSASVQSLSYFAAFSVVLRTGNITYVTRILSAGSFREKISGVCVWMKADANVNF